MNKVWLYIIDIFVGILIMFIAVTIYFGLRTETVTKSMYENFTEVFINDVKKKGYVTIRDYEDYLERMAIGSNIFDIDFEHRYKIYEPEYRFKTLEEVLEELKKKYTGTNEYHYREVKTEKPHVDDPINNGNLNTETNESILAKAENTPADPNHVHDENCYQGHKHQGNMLFIHNHAHNASCIEYISYIEIMSKCNTCSANYQGGAVDYYWDEATKSTVQNFVNLDGTRICPYCGSDNITNGSPIYYYQYSCGYDLVSGVMGSREKTPYGVVYYYEKPYPQYNNVSFTQRSGCYVYHMTKEISDLYEYTGFNHSLIESSVKNAFRQMINDNFQGYCYVPKYYRIGLSTRNYYNNSSLSDYPELCYITYQAYKSSSGEIRFKYVNYMYKDFYNDWINHYGSDNPGFPADLSVQELLNLQSVSTRIRNYFFNFFGNTYIERVSDYTTHQQWFRGVYVDTGLNLPYVLTDGTEYIRVCDFDHDLGVNRWITTCGYDEDSTADCNHIIVSLVPTHPVQTVYINDPLITTAKATYKDGSTKIVVCTANFTPASIVNDKDVTLTYNYTVDGSNMSISCNIKVTVIPRNKTCAKGHTYNLRSDGSDPGCPYCKAWIESLRVIRPTTSPIVITIGTTLQENGVVLLATYMDGHTEEVSSGYIDNLDKNYLGTMNVTIGYKGASVTVVVQTVCARVICDICGYEYELYPDGTNPGCPRCIQRIPVFTGNVMEYEHINHTNEILESLYSKGEYMFNINDVFSVSVRNKNTNMARLLLKKIYPSLTDNWIMINKSEYIMAK